MDSRRYSYSLHVEQQPQRARMCGKSIRSHEGFGDKDRRPITPPPCIRLSITDRNTGQEVDVSMLDVSFFVLTVDLWDNEAQHELNLVAYPYSSQTSQNQQVGLQNQATSEAPPVENDSRYRENGISTSSEAWKLPEYHSSLSKTSHSSLMHAPEHQNYEQLSRPTTQHAPGTYTRNLIGSLVASASKLNDTNDRLGIWFVLQDLSVRTEGTFRLKFNFVDLSTGSQSLLTNGSIPVLCSVFSGTLNVYSAKRFPGMIESTDISRKFSDQGIKIPVRKVEG